MYYVGMSLYYFLFIGKKRSAYKNKELLLLYITYIYIGEKRIKKEEDIFEFYFLINTNE
ncbi:hypothetical protein PFDG_01720 [Plasmodium falciparum Dd2]|uniref:Uncharacterized protein n=1 Tax=Plasmodium falciparum (isolate Dd2) TaxID=57267 RepID=A0A0L7M6Y3_PLAF4|nr:hypothetical protein PFDG_01720 [Plasmodium falciparum Dd2]